MSRQQDKEKILIVDDVPETLEVIRRNLNAKNYRVLTACNASEALDILSRETVDLLITDYKMPHISGLELIRHVRENHADMEVIMITGYATINGAVEAVKVGAEEYLAKPFTEQELFTAVQKAIDKLNERRSHIRMSRASRHSRYNLIGTSKAITKVFADIEKAAATNATVLVAGESGTGKELVARAIHYRGPRARGTFVPVNCGGIPESLLESELFGYAKGAFTGATESRAGFFQTAEGGSIFLDEISELGLAMQVKLLRALQEKEVYMVGMAKPRKVDVRIIAATNKDLATLVEKGQFREDLFFRLNVIVITLPPLRERNGDITLLIDYFSEKYAGEFNKPVPVFSKKALTALRSYDWPGNIRELENLIQRVIVMSDSGEIDMPDLPSPMRFRITPDKNTNRTLAQVEIDHIRNVVAAVGGNKSKAAEILGIDRKTLREKLKRQANPHDPTP